MQHQGKVHISFAGGGDTTVTVNGDGTGADAGGLSVDKQREIAWSAAADCYRARKKLGKKAKGDSTKLNVNFAVGILTIPPLTRYQKPIVESTLPILGTRSQPTHSEQRIVNTWQRETLPRLRLQGALAVGSHVILVIFTRTRMCPACQALIPRWMTELGTAAGPGVLVHFYIWQSIDPYKGVEPSNLEPMIVP